MTEKISAAMIKVALDEHRRPSPLCWIVRTLGVKCLETDCDNCCEVVLAATVEAWESDVSGLKQNLAGLERTCEMGDSMRAKLEATHHPS